ncbi:MAG: acyl-CoA dehydrogenase [Betaproteobacteria bacterium]|nr:acyl-CoA dehydrogenase [Betaproteobacteria bacterium]MDE2056066.1 acyl-CoA dehydrogenase [Betaproteobacteria bacterium]
MQCYKAPLKDIQFLLHDVLGYNSLKNCYDPELLDIELCNSVLEECAKFTESVLSPINKVGDQQGSTFLDGKVKTAEGFKEAYQQFINAGWNGLISSPDFGGQGLPIMLSAATEEMWHAANMSFTLCPLLTRGAIEAIEFAASHELKDKYLPNMIQGTWTGTMNLTEPQAGSDLSAIKTKAIKEDNHYKIFGQKIYITYGDHDLTDNIIHLVLARLPDAPPGIKGISLFLVPKYLVNDDGSLGPLNDIKTVSIEHKLGIHASPTCVLSYGDREGAIGYLIGEENRGIEIMFVMMNAARFSVGVQGYAIAEMAYQAAYSYTKERKQGIPIGSKEPLPILYHPDVAQSLLGLRLKINACRHLSYYAAKMLDLRRSHDDNEKLFSSQRSDLLTPIVKAFCTEIGNSICYESVQLFGGMGFIEETGVAQYFRDARITTIYEGTTGIQANDLLGRKILRDNGNAIQLLFKEIEDVLIETKKYEELATIATIVEEALTDARISCEHLISNPSLYNKYSHAKDLLMMLGWLLTGWLSLNESLVCLSKISIDEDMHNYYSQKLRGLTYYIIQFVPQCGSIKKSIVNNLILNNHTDINDLLSQQ